MKQFKFRLEAAKNHRELLLELARAELAEIDEKLTLAETLLTQCQETISSFVAQAPKYGTQFDPRNELVRQRHIYQLREEADKRKALVHQLGNIKKEKIEAVAESHRNLRAMELLEEKEFKIWQEEMKRREQKELDEFGGRRQP